MFLVLFSYNITIFYFLCVSSCLLECDAVSEFLFSLECAVYFLSCGHLFLCPTCSWFQCGLITPNFSALH
jgi:hypothetical protein